MPTTRSGNTYDYGDGTGALAVVQEDENGNPAAGGGAGTEFAEDAAHSSGALGKLALVVRRDADTSLVDTTGDYAPLQVDANGFLKVTQKAAAALPAGEAHLGQVGSPTVYVTSTPTLSVAGAYATGDYVGPTTTPASFAGVARLAGGRSIIKSLTITDKLTTAAVAMELWLFSATFTAPTDNAAWAITDAHQLLCVGIIPITTDKWYANSNGKVYSDDSLSKIVVCAATSLFYALVARGTTPAWTDQDLQLSLGILQS